MASQSSAPPSVAPCWTVGILVLAPATAALKGAFMSAVSSPANVCSSAHTSARSHASVSAHPASGLVRTAVSTASARRSVGNCAAPVWNLVFGAASITNAPNSALSPATDPHAMCLVLSCWLVATPVLVCVGSHAPRSAVSATRKKSPKSSLALRMSLMPALCNWKTAATSLRYKPWTAT